VASGNGVEGEDVVWLGMCGSGDRVNVDRHACLLETVPLSKMIVFLGHIPPSKTTIFTAQRKYILYLVSSITTMPHQQKTIIEVNKWIWTLQYSLGWECPLLGNWVKTFHPRNFGGFTSPANSEKWARKN
jgi:hypothetical protein